MKHFSKLVKYIGTTLLVANFTSCSSQRTHSFQTLQLAADSYNVIRPNIRFNVGPERSKEQLDLIVNELEKVPDAIQLYCNQAGATVEIFDRPMDEHPLYDNLVTWLEQNMMSTISGFYYPNTKTAVIPYDNFENPKFNVAYAFTEDVALHEYGHMVDHLMGYPSHSQEFATAFNDYLSKTKRSFISRFFLRRSELKIDIRAAHEEFANCFSQYYRSGDYRKRLQKYNPQPYDYFVKLESQLVKKRH